MTGIRYNAAHWGVYEVDPEQPGSPLSPWRNDPSPTPIGLDQRSAGVMNLRVTKPAIRASWRAAGHRATGAGRGAEGFVEIGWDEATDLIAAELERVRTAHGNQAIFGGSYGWASAGRFHHAQSQLHRFLNLAGGYTRSVDSYSLGAGRALMPEIVASMDDLSAGATSWDVIAHNTQLFVTFGGIPEKNAQVSPGGAGRHRVRGALRQAAAAGVRFVNLSPVRDNLDDTLAAEWVSIRPNTDTALMLALVHEIDRAGLADHAFLDRYCVGSDYFLTYVRGGIDGQPKTPAWAASITQVPERRIVDLAHEIATHRTMLNCAWSLQRASHGEQPFWAIVALAAMVGQIGLPGGGFAVGYGPMNAIGSAAPWLKGPTLDQGRNPVTAFIPVARIADMLLNPGAAFTYKGQGHTYPDIRLVWWAGGNPFHHHQDLNRLRQAFRRPETIIVQEQYWTPMARFADIVLPATTSLERNDIGFATREGLYVAMRRMADPPGEALDDHAILARIADRLGFGRAFTEGLDETGWLRRLYGQSRSKAAESGIPLPDFDDFWDQGLIDLSEFSSSQIAFSDFRADPLSHPLSTPSGRIEITSQRILSYALPDCPGHPAWMAPDEWLGADLSHAFPFHLISDQPARRLHSQLDHAELSRAGKIAGREPVHIHPADATARGIADGDIVELFNDRGRCLAGAVLSAHIMPGVLRLSTGAWADGDGPLDRHGNPNVLTRDRGASGFSQGCAALSCLVGIRRADHVPPVRAFDPPTFIA
ncbi:molybdopterin-dependent oxidoreductase [Gluconacetobacter takamatsuzukensis]|uniref:Molybdopterin-dependent oxidoreductase n=1 Tax=Gluconacetobacter takamatsuzukensis TaxID=1286190 RepID=A0A7W4KF64_9PROT|nr:molybdopterin-dependent oxidoreductase [Gluconacetobacter takamatsuzukensis]MBB2205827.1 molybdopterin-dependent oxidoreductase [Gluconacetobacter takamatsuzukensis]